MSHHSFGRKYYNITFFFFFNKENYIIQHLIHVAPAPFWLPVLFCLEPHSRIAAFIEYGALITAHARYSIGYTNADSCAWCFFGRSLNLADETSPKRPWNSIQAWNIREFFICYGNIIQIIRCCPIPTHQMKIIFQKELISNFQLIRMMNECFANLRSFRWISDANAEIDERLKVECTQWTTYLKNVSSQHSLWTFWNYIFCKMQNHNRSK